MGLQVWLPLNGNLNNQGLSNVTATNNGATVDNNGKIGKCYSFDGTDDFLSLTNINCNAWAQCTVSFWCYPTANFNYIFLIRGSGAHRFRISGDGLVFRDTNHSSQTSVSFNATIATNTWSHITCVYNRGEVFMYVNGILTNHSTTYYNSTSVLLSDLNEYRIARQQSSSGNNYYAGKINDFRIYNHALSAQEVKLLSQGLVLHYPLDRNGWGQDNLAHNTYGLSPFSTSQVEFKAYDVGVLDVTNGETITISFFLDMTVATAANSGYLQVYNTNYKGPHQIVAVNVLAGRKLVVGEDIHERLSFTTTINNRSDANRSTDVLEFYSNYNTENEIFISNIKVERGTKATQWSPNPSDTLYTTMDIGNVVEYDISGYQNNGEMAGSFSWVSNTPKYDVSTVFSSNAIKKSDFSIGNVWSAGIWFYPLSTISSGWDMLFGLNSSGGDADIKLGIWLNNSNGKMEFEANGQYDSTSVTIPSKDTWYYAMETFDGTTLSMYLNGELKKTKSITNTELIKNNLVVGGRSSSATLSSITSYFRGKLSDVRIYATALSADDIKSLYESNRL